MPLKDGSGFFRIFRGTGKAARGRARRRHRVREGYFCERTRCDRDGDQALEIKAKPVIDIIVLLPPPIGNRLGAP